MTYNKLPGISFSETVSTGINNNAEYIPLFIVQTTKAIAGVDNTITKYDRLDEFETIANGKDLTYAISVIEDTLIEYENTGFYVYSIKTDTATGFIDAVKSTAHLQDVKEIIYIEETKSSTSNSLTQKITSIKTGLVDNSRDGVFRAATIIPYGTVTSAVSAKQDNVTAEQAVVTAITSSLPSVGDGRIRVAVPDSNAGKIAGKILSTEYNDEPGRTVINSALDDSEYNFDANQMKTLMNAGVLFIRDEKVYGGLQHRICLGVNTAFKDDKADGLIVCRSVVDELLRRISIEATPFVKAKETESNEVLLQTVVDGIVNEFAVNEDINRDGTSVTVSGDGTVFEINGTIKPTKSAIAIEVNTTLN